MTLPWLGHYALPLAGVDTQYLHQSSGKLGAYYGMWQGLHFLIIGSLPLDGIEIYEYGLEK
jgi:hypothetical protein